MKNLPGNVKKFRSLIFAGILIMTLTVSTKASHMVGGEITYEWVSGNTYLIRMDFFRDCSGLSIPTTVDINYSSLSCGSGPFTVNLPMIGTPAMVTSFCFSSASNASCNGGLLYSTERAIFEGLVTLPGNCTDWIFSYDLCCRNAAITNLDNAAAQSMYISTLLNNADVLFNNSVRFAAVPVNIINNTATTSLSWSAYDVDGDSLSYELVNPRTSGPVNIAFVPGLSAQQPFLSVIPTTLNTSNGIMTITPNAAQIAVVAMKVTEYRQGVIIGEVWRDQQIAVINSPNNLPSLTGIDGSSSFVTNVCPGDTLSFEVFSSDPDAGQTLSLVPGVFNIAHTFNSGSGPNPIGMISITPGASDVSSMPYVMTIDVLDNNCDYNGSQTFAYQIYVNGCNTNEVWPGDANSDGTANLYDLLAIGIANGDNGPARPSASLAWAAQPVTDWTNSFNSGINHKHADTDGNGNVNADDTTAILLNYGFNHPLRVLPSSSLSTADLNVTTVYDTVGLQTTVHFDVELSTAADSIYGLAFRLFLNPALIDITSAQVTYPGSIFGTNGVDMYKLDKYDGISGYLDIALTRMNQQNITGTGHVTRVTIVTTDNVSGKVTLSVEPSDVMAITANELPVTINTSGASVIIDPNYLGINENDITEFFNYYPVPVSDILNISYSGKENIRSLNIYDVTGKEVLHYENKQNEFFINVDFLSEGVYYIKVEIGNSSVIKKLIKI